MKMKWSPEYTAVACNRCPEIVDWDSDGRICFGGSNAVVLYDTNLKGEDPISVLAHHKSKVNSVKWLRKPSKSCTELVSCSADKTAAIWSLSNGVWQVTSKLVGHTNGITCVGGIYLNEDDLLIFTGSVDSTIRIWERRNGITTLKQTIHLNMGLCLTLQAYLLPNVNKPILFCAMDDHKIHVYTPGSVPGEAGDVEEYHKVHVLVGHEDWVRGLDVMDVDKDTILLASASQDTYIRLWRIQRDEADPRPSSEIRVEQRVFNAHGVRWAVKLDAVLAGHEGWVYGVQWAPRNKDNPTEPVYRLLSSSLDKTLIVWEPDDTKGGEGVWVERVRVGEVGGNGLGFYGSRFGPQGSMIMGHGYNGSLHIWKVNEESGQWEPSVVIGGHFSEVEDLRWEPTFGRYIMSVSADQTTRIHAPWKDKHGSKPEWHEIARPQVHGYDMSSIALVSSAMFVSAAEEKVIRVFKAPHNFLDNFTNITGHVIKAELNGLGPEGASVPSLGLSNKAVFAGQHGREDIDEDEHDGYFVPVKLEVPPTEETLMQNTLWPETSKLYGHGYEVYCLDASPDGRVVASACKATTAEHASVLIWETKSWEQIQKLTSHSLTVTQLAFSPDSQYLLSVSRDRRWTLYKDSDGGFKMAAATDKSNGVHSRIIWCCAWARDSRVFATGSRDGKVCLWSETTNRTESSLNNYALHCNPLELPNSSVTALSFAPIQVGTCRILAVGLETGHIKIYTCNGAWEMLCDLDNSAAHHLTVKRLQFKPRSDDDEENQVQLASCGADHFVRIYNITVST